MTGCKRWLTLDLRGKLRLISLSPGGQQGRTPFSPRTERTKGAATPPRVLVKVYKYPSGSVIQFVSKTAQARPFMLLCAPRFSPAFVGLKGLRPLGTRISAALASAASLSQPHPEARRPQSHCTTPDRLLSAAAGVDSTNH